MKYAKYGMVGLCLSSVSTAALAQVQEIVVTATKEEETLSTVPVTVNAFAEETLEEANIESLQDVALLAPSLQVNFASSQFGSRISIRGIGTYQTDPALEPSVGLFVDGVFLARSGLGLSDLSDVERVEVLQGPQGTLYGKNANAGAISVTTKRPSLDGVEGFAEVSVGNFSLVEITGGISTPLSDTLAIRVSGNYKRRNGIFDNSLGSDLSDVGDWNVQGKLFWQPTDNFSVLVSGSHLEIDTTCCGSDATVSDATNAALVAAGFPAEDNEPFDFNVSVDQDSAFELNSELIYISAKYETDFGIITSSTAWDNFTYLTAFDVDRTALDVLRVEENSGGDSFSQELRFNSDPIGDLEFMAGLFYFNQHTRRGDGTPFAIAGADFITVGSAQGIPFPAPLAFTIAPGDFLRINSTIDTETFAVFGQATWHIGDLVHLTGGLRFSDESKEASLFNETVSTAPSTALGFSLLDGFLTPIDADLERSSSNVDWLVRASLDLNDSSILFASISTGTKSGGINTSTGQPADREFDDERTTNVELGVKYTSPSRIFRANGTVFYTVVRDFQFQTQLPSGAGLFVSNDAEVEVSGVDFQFEVVPSDNFEISGGALYLHKYEVTEGVNAGEELNYTADWKFNISPTFRFPVGDGELFWRSDFSYTSDHQVTRIRQDRTLVNSSLGWRNGTWDISIWTKNLFDEEYVIEAPETFAFTGTNAFNLGQPMTFGASARINF